MKYYWGELRRKPWLILVLRGSFPEPPLCKGAARSPPCMRSSAALSPSHQPAPAPPAQPSTPMWLHRPVVWRFVPRKCRQYFTLTNLKQEDIGVPRVLVLLTWLPEHVCVQWKLLQPGEGEQCTFWVPYFELFQITVLSLLKVNGGFRLKDWSLHRYFTVAYLSVLFFFPVVSLYEEFIYREQEKNPSAPTY